MADQPRIGWIGVGLMGHGAAKNILERGRYPLAILGNSNREPVDDLVRRGAGEAADPQAVAAASESFFCACPRRSRWRPFSPVTNGLIAGVRTAMTLVDCTTSDPAVTRRLGA